MSNILLPSRRRSSATDCSDLPEGGGFYSLKAQLPGKNRELPMAAYRGDVVLIVNTASSCGFTVQYSALQALHEKYGSDGGLCEPRLRVVGFPCGQFAGQELATDGDIETSCTRNFGVTFPLAKKSDVNGPDTCEVFKYLKNESHTWGRSIKWNFTKFLVDRRGNVVGRYAPWTKPEDIESTIVRLLNE